MRFNSMDNWTFDSVFSLLEILNGIFLIAVIVVIVLPPHWPIKRHWGQLQVIKAMTTAVFLIDLLLFVTGLELEHQLLPGGAISVEYIILSALCGIITEILGVYLLVYYYRWYRQKRSNNAKSEQTQVTPRIYVLRILLIAIYLVVMGIGFAHELHELLKPNPDWNEFYENMANLGT